MSLGALSAQAGIEVTGGGQASYSYEVPVPPGVAGVVPQIALNYVDGAPAGTLGAGWQMQALSVVTRCPASKAIDGTPRNVDFTAADKLCLDGQRLIQTDATGTPAAFPQSNDAQGCAADTLCREFRTEKDSFARIRSYGQASGNAANGPATIKVWTKNGRIYEYGLVAGDGNALIGAQNTTQNATAVMVWALRRVSDVAGNYAQYYYTVRDTAWGSGTVAAGSVGREWNLSEIRYGATASSPGMVRVVFDYTDRASTALPGYDRSETYQFGYKNLSIRLLSAIRSYVNWPGNLDLGAKPSTAVLVRKTLLDYQRGATTGRSRLVSIRECTDEAGATCLPATTFAYSDNAAPSYTANASFNLKWTTLLRDDGKTGVLTGDFDGDGKTDILPWSSTPADNRLWRSKGDGTFEQLSAFNVKSDQLGSSDGCLSSEIHDFNGDGLSDILRTVGSGCSGSNLLFLSNGDGTFNKVVLPSGIVLQDVKATKTQKGGVACQIPNFAPVVAASSARKGSASGSLSGALAASDSVVSPTASSCITYTRGEGRRYYILDLNGDGYLDIVTTIAVKYTWNSGMGPLPDEESLCMGEARTGAPGGICTKVYLGSAAGTFSEMTSPKTNVAYTSLYRDPPSAKDTRPYWRMPDVADIDGDGLQDILAQYTGSWISSGDGNFVTGSIQDSSQTCGTPIDFNGDGRSDCLYPDSTASSQSLNVSYGLRSSGALAQFNLKSVGQNLYAKDSNDRQTVGMTVGDFDGDGREDILRWGPTPATDNGIFLSNGDGSFRPMISAGLQALTKPLQSVDGKVSFHVGDFLGNGTLQILHVKSGQSSSGDDPAKTNQLYQLGYTPQADLLVSVTSAYGLVERVTGRVSIANSGGRYTNDRGTGNAATGDLVDLQPPTYVVTSVQRETGNGTLTTEYAYAGLKADRKGRGFAGYREMRRQEPAPDGSTLTTVTRNLQVYPYTGAAGVVETYRGPLALSGATLLRRSTNSYCDKTSTATPLDVATVGGTAPAPCAVTSKVQRPYVYQSLEEAWDLATPSLALPTARTTSSYNDYGDPVSIVVETKDAAAGETFIKATTNSYNQAITSGDNWIIGRLGSATVSNTVPSTLRSTSAGTSPNASSNKGTGTVQATSTSQPSAATSAVSR